MCDHELVPFRAVLTLREAGASGTTRLHRQLFAGSRGVLHAVKVVELAGAPVGGSPYATTSLTTRVCTGPYSPVDTPSDTWVLVEDTSAMASNDGRTADVDVALGGGGGAPQPFGDGVWVQLVATHAGTPEYLAFEVVLSGLVERSALGRS